MVQQTNINEYTSAVESILIENGINHYNSFLSLLNIWQELIEDCEKGYNYNAQEYKNDVFVRDIIEILSMNNLLKKYPEHTHWISEVNKLDDRLKKILVNKTENSDWWNYSTPRFRKGDYT